MNDTKENIIKLLDKLNYDKGFVDTIKNFINSYNGTNEQEFSALMYQLVIYVMYVQELEQKAKGFDGINEANEDFLIAANRIKSDFERITAGKDLPNPAQPSSN